MKNPGHVDMNEGSVCLIWVTGPDSVTVNMNLPHTLNFP